MNSFLAPQGVDVRVQPDSANFLKVLIDFRRPRRREACLHLRDRLARAICYRLWTLNSDVIQGVRMVARVAGEPKILWQLSVRINSPAANKLRRAEAVNLRQMQAMNQLKFRIARSLFMSSITLAGFFIGYWLFYLEMGKVFAKSKPTDPSFFANHPEVAPIPPQIELSQTEIVPQISAPPGRVNFLVPEQFKGQVVSQVDVPETEKVIALTFDDGPHPSTTAQVLEMLKQYSAKATFFVSGAGVEASPALVRRIVAEGHALGNRAWNQMAEETSNLDATREVDETADLIQEVTGAKTELFRPPNGRLDTKLVSYAQKQGYAVTLWSVDSQDSLVAAPILLDNVLKNARPGRVVLLHDGSGDEQSATIQALPQLLTALQQQGYRFVTIPELLKIQLKAQQQDETRLPLRKRAIAQASVAQLVPLHASTVPID
jgi:chitin deacetylase